MYMTSILRIQALRVRGVRRAAQELLTKIGEASRHTCRVTGITSVAVPVAEDPESDGDYDPSSGGWGSVESSFRCSGAPRPLVRFNSRESWEYDW